METVGIIALTVALSSLGSPFAAAVLMTIPARRDNSVLRCWASCWRPWRSPTNSLVRSQAKGATALGPQNESKAVLQEEVIQPAQEARLVVGWLHVVAVVAAHAARSEQAHGVSAADAERMRGCLHVVLGASLGKMPHDVCFGAGIAEVSAGPPRGECECGMANGTRHGPTAVMPGDDRIEVEQLGRQPSLCTVVLIACNGDRALSIFADGYAVWMPAFRIPALGGGVFLVSKRTACTV